MDSLSQIVLGAAVGEAVLGKKIGNRAMAIGAVAGTIPDLDVIANPFLTPMQAMDFHRGISHSVLFSVAAPLLFGGITYFFFKKDIHKKNGYRLTIGALPLIPILFLGIIAIYSAIGISSYWGAGISLFIMLALSIPIIRYIRKTPREIEYPSYMNWYWFFFWCFATHILLDVFTTYGTQVFMPFSNMRATFSFISVVDPLYTLPFLLILLIASFMRRQSRARRITNWAGIIISSLYLLFAVFNKTATNQVVKDSLKEKGLTYERYMTSPTLFNTFLWSSTIEMDSSYLIGNYSKYDPEKRIKNFIEIPKNHHLLAGHEEDEHVEILSRFSNGYYHLRYNQDSTAVEWIDLRWGALDNIVKDLPKEERFPMVYQLEKQNGQFVVVQQAEQRMGEEDETSDILGALTRLPNFLMEMHEEYPNLFSSYWDRIMGRWQ